MKKILILILFLSCLTFHSRATHIMGGGLNLVWQHDSIYLLQLRIFRDCNYGRAAFDDPLILGIFSKSGNSRIATVSMNLDSVKPVSFDTNSCFNTNSPVLCQEVGYYNKLIVLSPRIYNDSNGYYISWERCCRDISQNIKTPETVGITFYLEIPSPQKMINSTPKWNNVLNKVLCKGQLFSYNFNFTDADGDSLHYSLVNPLQGNLDAQFPVNNGNPLPAPYPRVTWEFGYDSLHHIRGNPPLSIDQNTGTVTVTPDSAGIYVSAINVEEFHAGKKIGETRLELKYYVGPFVSIPPPIGINEIKNTGHIVIYPNPSSDKIVIDLTTLKDAEEFMLTDINGKTVLQKHITGIQSFMITKNELPSGIYVFHITQTDGSVTRGKLILKD